MIRALTTRVAERLHDVVAGLGAGLDAQPTRSIRDQVETRVAAYLAGWRDEGPVLRAMVPLYESDPELRAFWDRIVGELSDQVVGAIEQAREQARAPAREQATDETETGRPDPRRIARPPGLGAALFP